MYLETWMIGMIVLSYGTCAWFCTRRGFENGAVATLQALEQQRLIKLEEDGTIKRWTPYNDTPVKKKRNTKGVK